jgi:hypothetical protein
VTRPTHLDAAAEEVARTAAADWEAQAAAARPCVACPELAATGSTSWWATSRPAGARSL